MENCVGIGCLSYNSEKEKYNQLFNLECAAKGQQYNKLVLTPAMFDAIPIISSLLSLDDSVHKKIMAECCKEMLAAGVEGIEPPNFKYVKTVTSTVYEKYGLIKKKTRAVEKTEPNPDFKKIEDIIAGEKCIFIESFRYMGDDDNKDWEGDEILAVTESGRLVSFKYEIRTYYRSKSSDGRVLWAKENLQSDKNMNVLMAIMIAKHLGVDRFNEIHDRFYTVKPEAPVVKEKVKTKEELEKEAEKAARYEELKQKYVAAQPDEDFVYVPKYDLEMKEHAYLQAQFDALSPKEKMLGLRTLPTEQRNPEYIRKWWKNEDLARLIYISKKQGS